MTRSRVVIHVLGGVADWTCDDGVEVILLDWDNIQKGSGIPDAEDMERFSDLIDDLDRMKIDEYREANQEE